MKKIIAVFVCLIIAGFAVSPLTAQSDDPNYSIHYATIDEMRYMIVVGQSGGTSVVNLTKERLELMVLKKNVPMWEREDKKP